MAHVTPSAAGINESVFFHHRPGVAVAVDESEFQGVGRGDRRTQIKSGKAAEFQNQKLCATR